MSLTAAKTSITPQPLGEASGKRETDEAQFGNGGENVGGDLGRCGKVRVWRQRDVE